MPFPYYSRLSSTIRAFLRLSQPWAEHDLRLAIEKKLKTAFSKKRKEQNALQEAKTRALLKPDRDGHPCS
jgi:hypothetical protein